MVLKVMTLCVLFAAICIALGGGEWIYHTYLRWQENKNNKEGGG